MPLWIFPTDVFSKDMSFSEPHQGSCFRVAFISGDENINHIIFFSFHIFHSIKLFQSFPKQLLMNFLRFSENYQEKIMWQSLCLVIVQFLAPPRMLKWEFPGNFRTTNQQSNCERLSLRCLFIYLSIFLIFPIIRFSCLKPISAHLSFVKN